MVGGNTTEGGKGGGRGSAGEARDGRDGEEKVELFEEEVDGKGKRSSKVENFLLGSLKGDVEDGAIIR